MEHDPSKLMRGGRAFGAPTWVRSHGFPVHKERDSFMLTGSLLHLATEVARRIDRCILDLLNDITRSDTLAVRFGRVINRRDRHSIHVPEGIALARCVGNGRHQHPEVW